MFLIELLFVFVLALILSGVLAWGIGWRHPASAGAAGTSALFLFLILMFAMWAGGAWLPPWGPIWQGTPWLSLLLIGFLVSLLVLAVATPARRPPRTRREATEQAEEAAVLGTAFGLFFWLLLLVLLIAVVIRYL